MKKEIIKISKKLLFTQHFGVPERFGDGFPGYLTAQKGTLRNKDLPLNQRMS
jgi:hypothetical protein